MTNNVRILSAIAALFLAVIYPTYWVSQLGSYEESGPAAIYNDVSQLSLFDGLFLIMGLLTMAVYWGLKDFLNKQHEFNATNIPLILLIIVSAVHTFGSLMIDITFQILGDQLYLPWHSGAMNGTAVFTVIILVMFGILDILLGVMLQTGSRELPSSLRAFGIVTIVLGVLEVTVVLSAASLVIFPVSLIILAIAFLKQPSELEVV